MTPPVADIHPIEKLLDLLVTEAPWTLAPLE